MGERLGLPRTPPLRRVNWAATHAPHRSRPSPLGHSTGFNGDRLTCAFAVHPAHALRRDAMFITTEPCFDCGQEVADGAGESVQACIWSLPGAGQHWAWVPVCACCAARRRYWHVAAWGGTALLVAVLTAFLAFPFIP
jgi:hypothetical protein